ncbi:hypothetical protein TKK_0017022 [Trichogramma kaykai]
MTNQECCQVTIEDVSKMRNRHPLPSETPANITCPEKASQYVLVDNSFSPRATLPNRTVRQSNATLPAGTSEKQSCGSV